MKLLVNLSMLGPQPTGLGVYATHAVKAACSAFQTEVIAPPSYEGPGHVTLRSPQNIVLGAGKAAPLRRWWWASRQRPEAPRLAYSPTHHGLAREGRQILTVHDLIALRFPQQHPTQNLFFRHVLPRQLRRCEAVFTVSETTKHDIAETYGYPLDAIHVVPNGVDTTVFKPAARPQPRQPFLLIVGAAYPHKNVDELIDMAHLWKDRYRLLIASCRGKYREHLEQRVRERGLEEKVEFLAYVSLADLVTLYQTCSAFVYPSKWEGFGIPPLEAMACGAPVIASDIPAHREVLGEHARLVTLGDEAGWASALASLDQPRPVPTTISPLKHWTWERSAERLVESLRAVCPGLKAHAQPAPRPAARTSAAGARA